MLLWYYKGDSLKEEFSILERIDLEDLKKVAIEAGEIILKVYYEDFSVIIKDDNTPLTLADTQANDIICRTLKKLYPTIPIVSEENHIPSFSSRKKWNCYFCIDPLDGTKEFIKKNGEFTVNIGLICNNIPIIGIVYAPVLKKIYYGKKGYGSFYEDIDSFGNCIEKRKLPFSKKDHDNIVIGASQTHLSKETQEFINSLKNHFKDTKLILKGSSLKICMVATGEIDIYPRLGPTMEWDTAAAHAILLQSRKNIYQYNENIHPIYYIDSDKNNLKTLEYNKMNPHNPWFVVS